MGIGATFFFSTDPAKQTLYKRICPSEDQITYLQEQWNTLSDALLNEMARFTTHPVSTWIQGSYKFGTLIRPVSKDEEYDVDLGLYIHWTEDTDEHIPDAEEAKQWVQESLQHYAIANGSVLEVVAPAKERCSRIRFRNQFHIDVPCYHEDEEVDRRWLATKNDGWEDSDPKALIEWFRETVEDEDRAELRRVIRYLKAWAALKFESEHRPSSLMLTVLAAESYLSLDTRTITGDDELLASIVESIIARLSDNSFVENPVNGAENLNRLNNSQLTNCTDRLKDLHSTAIRATASRDAITAANIWGEQFEHFFPLLELEPEQAGNARLPALPMPEINIVVQEQKSKRYLPSWTNLVTSVPIGCTLYFQVTNPQMFPADAIYEWTVRNEGSDAEEVNDLGHKKSGPRLLQVDESTKYRGRHYMDCLVKRGTTIVGFRRVPVRITGQQYPERNPPKPPWTTGRKK